MIYELFACGDEGAGGYDCPVLGVGGGGPTHADGRGDIPATRFASADGEEGRSTCSARCLGLSPMPSFFRSSRGNSSLMWSWWKDGAQPLKMNLICMIYAEATSRGPHTPHQVI